MEQELSGDTRSHCHSTNLGTLQNDDLDILLCGSQLGRWRLAAHLSLSESDYSDNEESTDEDYNPLLDLECDVDISDSSSESSTDLNDELQNILDSSHDNEDNFLDELLHRFKQLDNKHDWSNVNPIEFAKEFLKDKQSASKLFHDELDVICELTLTYTGVKMYNKSSTKKEKVDWLICNIHQSECNINGIQSSHQNDKILKSLFQWAKKMLHKYYPKLFLLTYWMIGNAIVQLIWTFVLRTITMTISLYMWVIHIQTFHQVGKDMNIIQWTIHIFSQTWDLKLVDMVTNGVHKEASLRVSDTGHNVLPRTIIEDQLDKQSSDLAKWFFSEDVENVLYQNKDYSEAKFVCLTRNWYEACDKRGIPTSQRLHYMQEMFNHLNSWIDLTDFPPPTKYVNRNAYSNFWNGSTKYIYMYAIICFQQSTYQSESDFHSGNRKMEFTGIGCPKSVDILRLISYVTSLNNIWHDPDR